MSYMVEFLFLKQRRNIMHKLFIIGNGFDCYSHFDKNDIGMKTRYKDFKDYIISRYPDITYNNGVPEQYLTADHHDYDYDEDEVAGYIVQILDCCQDDNWSTLEKALGDDIYVIFAEDFLDVDILNQKDSEISRSIAANENMGSAIRSTFILLKELFVDWVNDELKNLPYKNYAKRKNFKKVLVGHPLLDLFKGTKRTYLNFNYTVTLEKIYKIAPNKVFHLHGKPGETIYFGHGNDNDNFETYGTWGAEDDMDYIKKYFLKDTQDVISQNYNFFDSLKDVNEIYSYGFSFSDVDMVYIDEICKHINPSNVVWYFNKYDAKNNKSYLDKIESKGFCVKIESRW